MKTPWAKAAKDLKVRLVEMFPNAKFSVTTMTGANCTCMSVLFSGDADDDVVRQMADEYKEGYFDGMNGTYNYKDIMPKYGTKYVYVRRTDYVPEEYMRHVSPKPFVSAVIRRVAVHDREPQMTEGEADGMHFIEANRTNGALFARKHRAEIDSGRILIALDIRDELAFKLASAANSENDLRTMISRFNKADMIPTVWMVIPKRLVLGLLAEAGMLLARQAILDDPAPGHDWLLGITEGGCACVQIRKLEPGSDDA